MIEKIKIENIKPSTRQYSYIRIKAGERIAIIGPNGIGKLMLQRRNVLLLDEPTNHLDMECIESLNTALEKFQDTLIFVSHDCEFISSLATRIIEMTPEGIQLHAGGYDEHLIARGIAA